MGKERATTRSALIIIDVQRDFCPGGSLAVRDGDAIIPLINRLAPRFPLVVATQDWHPKGHISFASAHPGTNPFETIDLDGETTTLWPDHCIQGAPGAEFAAGFDPSPVDLILHKGRSRGLDSYSAFFENDHRTPTGLQYYLDGFKAKELYFCGLATDVCVFHSVIDALGLGYRCHIITDAMRGVDLPEGSSAQAVETMIAKGAAATSSEKVAP